MTDADADSGSRSRPRSPSDASADSDSDSDPELAFELPNVGPGPDPFAPSAVEADFLLVVFQRDYYCGNCRQQVKALARRYDSFRERGAEVASVLPESRERTAEWRSQYDLPFPTLADPDSEVGDQYDQPVRYGLLGRLHDVVGRMPAVAILDCRGETPGLRFAHRGSSPADRPTPEALLARLDRAAASPTPGEEADGESTADDDDGDDDGGERVTTADDDEAGVATSGGPDGDADDDSDAEDGQAADDRRGTTDEDGPDR
ncbi:MAG: peroxiredoxin family protein [Halolamina sp.]